MGDEHEREGGYVQFHLSSGTEFGVGKVTSMG